MNSILLWHQMRAESRGPIDHAEEAAEQYWPRVDAASEQRRDDQVLGFNKPQPPAMNQPTLRASLVIQNVNADLGHSITDAVEELSRFVDILHKRFGGQLPHDVLHNLPGGMVEYKKLPKHAVRLALVCAVGEYLNWDTEQVARFAAELLEDSNIHHLARIVYDQIENYYGNDEELPA